MLYDCAIHCSDTGHKGLTSVCPLSRHQNAGIMLTNAPGKPGVLGHNMCLASHGAYIGACK